MSQTLSGTAMPTRLPGGGMPLPPKTSKSRRDVRAGHWRPGHETECLQLAAL
jgi:hypothetical protein